MFKTIPGHSEYAINEDGSILKRIAADKPSRLKEFVKPYFIKDKGKEYPMGYWYAKLLTQDWKSKLGHSYQLPVAKTVSIHRLVALAWISPEPEGMPWVNHEDGVKINNHYTNLKWGSISYNIQHAHKMGLVNHPSGTAHYMYGKKVKSSTKKLMSAAKIGTKHPRYNGQWSTPNGIFTTTREAAKANNISHVYIYIKCKTNVQGYSFIPKSV